MDVAEHYLEDLIGQIRTYRTLADGAIAQVSDAELFAAIGAESNSIAVVMRHIAGNLKSRFTDFLTSDGEKPDRHRDGEFEIPAGTSRETIVADWDLGFARLEEALAALTPQDLSKEIAIRGQRHTVVQALNRAFGHLAMHIGQIVLLAKYARGSQWRTLSIPRGQSEQFNARMKG